MDVAFCGSFHQQPFVQCGLVCVFDDGHQAKGLLQFGPGIVEAIAKLRAKTGVCVDFPLGLCICGSHRLEERHAFEDRRFLELELEIQWPRGDLRHDLQFTCEEFLGAGKQLPVTRLAERRARQKCCPADLRTGFDGQLLQLIEHQAGAERRLKHSAPRLPDRGSEGPEFLEVCGSARYRSAFETDVRLELGRRQPERASLQGFLHKGAHGRKLIGFGGAFGGAFAHHVKTKRRVSQQYRYVDGTATLLQKS